MKHENLRWNPGTGEWFCTKCGRASDHVSVHYAQVELDQYECRVPSAESPRFEPGAETTRLIRKPYKMTLRTERSGGRFLVTSDEGKPVIQLDLFHDTVAVLKSLSLGFELLSGTTLEQARALVDVMNGRIV